MNASPGRATADNRTTMSTTAMNETEPLLYTVAEVARKLRLGVSTLYRMMDDGIIKYHRIGKSTRRISKAEIERFLRDTAV